MSPPVVVVGAGIGGMAFAAALCRLGKPVVVLERAARLGEIGSGLGILPSAVRALEALGVSSTLMEQSARLSRLAISTHRGRDLIETDFSPLFREAGRDGYVMLRTALHSALCAAARTAIIRCAACVTAIVEKPEGVDVHVEGDDEPIRASLVVGADGLHSVVRRFVLGDATPRYASSTAFRGIADVQLDPPDVCREILGPGRRLGYYDLGGGRCYWWAITAQPQGVVVAPENRPAFLRERYGDWPFGVGHLLAHTPSERILQNDVFDRKPARTWHTRRTVLLGDAAHPTTPNLGQGACMAIEDAVVLARLLAQHEQPHAAFAAFEQARRQRTAWIVRRSRLWGVVGNWESGPAMALRERLYRAIPRTWFEKQLREQYTYDPGTLEPQSPLPGVIAA
jgi:2-polyprenyl-6-methoxyphenol hydroxylase-like FAD-dependent oxidoreductase